MATKTKTKEAATVSGGGGAGKGAKPLAWVSFGAALVGGSALSATFVGGWIGGLVGLFPIGSRPGRSGSA